MTDGAALDTSILHPAANAPPSVDVAALLAQLDVWRAELHESYNEHLAPSAVPKEVFAGWLVEMYHYIRDFPAVIDVAAERASGPLLQLLRLYGRQEVGHENFVLETLRRIGLPAGDVVSSRPLVSTTAIGLLMRELVAANPGAMLLIAHLIEADGFDEAVMRSLDSDICSQHGFPEQAMAPLFEHQRVDFELGHYKLLADNLGLIQIGSARELQWILDKMCQLKEAYQLLGIEVQASYKGRSMDAVIRRPVRIAAAG
ncbi:MAG TPA: hypothetical protein VEZ20_02945 [Allosphingosinicella sp.]|nr:hypothetical protein [Allosphingosinicella sp.]